MRKLLTKSVGNYLAVLEGKKIGMLYIYDKIL